MLYPNRKLIFIIFKEKLNELVPYEEIEIINLSEEYQLTKKSKDTFVAVVEFEEPEQANEAFKSYQIKFGENQLHFKLLDFPPERDELMPYIPTDDKQIDEPDLEPRNVAGIFLTLLKNVKVL